MAATIASLIQVDENGVPWIAGTTCKVIEVVLTKQANGWTPEEVQDALPHLSLAQVYGALAYYYAHQEALDADMERRRQWAEEMRAHEKNPFSKSELLARLQPKG